MKGGKKNEDRIEAQIRSMNRRGQEQRRVGRAQVKADQIITSLRDRDRPVDHKLASRAEQVFGGYGEPGSRIRHFMDGVCRTAKKYPQLYERLLALKNDVDKIPVSYTLKKRFENPGVTMDNIDVPLPIGVSRQQLVSHKEELDKKGHVTHLQTRLNDLLRRHLMYWDEGGILSTAADHATLRRAKDARHELRGMRIRVTADIEEVLTIAKLVKHTPKLVKQEKGREMRAPDELMKLAKEWAALSDEQRVNLKDDIDQTYSSFVRDKGLKTKNKRVVEERQPFNRVSARDEKYESLEWSTFSSYHEVEVTFQEDVNRVRIVFPPVHYQVLGERVIASPFCVWEQLQGKRPTIVERGHTRPSAMMMRRDKIYERPAPLVGSRGSQLGSSHGEITEGDDMSRNKTYKLCFRGVAGPAINVHEYLILKERGWDSMNPAQRYKAYEDYLRSTHHIPEYARDAPYDFTLMMRMPKWGLPDDVYAIAMLQPDDPAVPLKACGYGCVIIPVPAGHPGIVDLSDDGTPPQAFLEPTSSSDDDVPPVPEAIPTQVSNNGASVASAIRSGGVPDTPCAIPAPPPSQHVSPVEPSIVGEAMARLKASAASRTAAKQAIAKMHQESISESATGPIVVPRSLTRERHVLPGNVTLVPGPPPSSVSPSVPPPAPHPPSVGEDVLPMQDVGTKGTVGSSAYAFPRGLAVGALQDSQLYWWRTRSKEAMDVIARGQIRWLNLAYLPQVPRSAKSHMRHYLMRACAMLVVFLAFKRLSPLILTLQAVDLGLTLVEVLIATYFKYAVQIRRFIGCSSSQDLVDRAETMSGYTLWQARVVPLADDGDNYDVRGPSAREQKLRANPSKARITVRSYTYDGDESEPIVELVHSGEFDYRKARDLHVPSTLDLSRDIKMSLASESRMRYDNQRESDQLEDLSSLWYHTAVACQCHSINKGLLDPLNGARMTAGPPSASSPGTGWTIMNYLSMNQIRVLVFASPIVLITLAGLWGSTTRSALLIRSRAESSFQRLFQMVSMYPIK